MDAKRSRRSRYAQLNPATQFLDALLKRALKGDKEAEEEARNQAAAMAKKVNRQLREFEKADVSSAALERVQYFLLEERGAKRFRERTKTQDLRQLAEDADAMGIFLRSEGYSIAEAKLQKEQSEQLAEVLTQVFGKRPDDHLTKSMEELFRSDAWQEVKKAHGRSTGLIYQAQDAFKRGRLVDDLVGAYEDFKTTKDNRMDITKVWRKFTGKRWTRSKK